MTLFVWLTSLGFSMENSQNLCEEHKWLLKHLHPVCTQLHFPNSHLLCCYTLLHIKSGQGNLKCICRLVASLLFPSRRQCLRDFFLVWICFVFFSKHLLWITWSCANERYVYFFYLQLLLLCIVSFFFIIRGVCVLGSEFIFTKIWLLCKK